MRELLLSRDALTTRAEGYLFDPNTAFAQQLCGAPFSGNVR